MTQEGVRAGPLETGRDPCYLAGKQHGIDISSTQQEAMDDVLAGPAMGQATVDLLKEMRNAY